MQRHKFLVESLEVHGNYGHARTFRSRTDGSLETSDL